MKVRRYQMSHHHPAYYQIEARIQQARKVNQARRWHMTRQARGKRAQSSPEPTGFLAQLRSFLSDAVNNRFHNSGTAP
jgi:hypothetical protein